MATANDIFSETNSEEKHIVIDKNRIITVPSELQRIAVQYDHDIETVTFDCPRYWDEHDLSEMIIYINYRLPNGVVGCYKATNVIIDDTNTNMFHFNWTLSRNVTSAVGKIIFLVCAKKMDSEGNEINHWNSELNQEMYISQGLESVDTVVEDYPDVITQLIMSKAESEFETKNISERVIDGQIKSGFEWSTFDKVYLTMTFDDSNSDIDLLEDMAEELSVPLCFATIPSRLNDACTNGETVKEVLTRAVQNGGEILSHYGTPLTNTSTDEDYRKVYIDTKKVLEENGFDVNGIITAGGADYQTQDFAKATELARIYYQYADLTASNNKLDRQFYNVRKFTDNGLAATKEYIDSIAANGNGWINLASHGTNNANTSTVNIFKEIFEYAKSKNIEIVTWKYLFDKFGKIKNNCQIKSISVNGKSVETDNNGNANLEISSSVNEEWRLILDDTLSDEVQQVYKNKDMNGNSFNFKKLKIYVKSPTNTVMAPITINIAGALRASLANAITTAVRYSLFTIECDNLACIINGVTGATAASYGMSSGYTKTVNFDLTNISDFTVRCNNTQTKLLAGTVIKVWGC